jgi:2-polyprenyl-6-methoxyphenol hydroxylase-like FAD-dependent oxidoreductase
MVRFEIDIQEIIDSKTSTPKLKIGATICEFDLIIGCDGGKSMVRPYVTDLRPKYSGYCVWRGLVK